MATVLLAALHHTGAAANLRPLVRTLIGHGHDPIVLSDPAAEAPMRALGAGFAAVADPVLPSVGQGPATRLERIRRLRPNMRSAFLEPIPRQWAALQRVLADRPVDVVLTDLMVMGVGILATVPRDARPPVVSIGTVPPPAPDPDIAPYGSGLPPRPGTVGRIRNLALHRLVVAPALGELDRELVAAVRTCTGRVFGGSIWDVPSIADVWAQASVDRFEYPRSRYPQNLRWIGPLSPVREAAAPDDWDPVTAPPVVVLQTHDRIALDRLVLPAIEALRDDDASVVVVGATRAATAAASARPLPANVRFEAAVPWSRLRPDRAVFVSTGDYVQVQHALRCGVPVVVTGASEPQVETNARVVWAGVGVEVSAARPSAAMLRAAIARVRTDPQIRFAVARIAAQIDRTLAESTLCELVDELVLDGVPR